MCVALEFCAVSWFEVISHDYGSVKAIFEARWAVLLVFKQCGFWVGIDLRFCGDIMTDGAFG